MCVPGRHFTKLTKEPSRESRPCQREVVARKARPGSRSILWLLFPLPACPSTFTTPVARMAECRLAAACGSRVLGTLASEGCALLLHLCCQCGLWDVPLPRLPASGHSKIQGVDAGQGHQGRDAVSSCVTLEAQLVSILFTC